MKATRHLGDVELLVLSALVRLGPEAYGVSIAREIEDQGRRLIALGSIYSALERLEKKKYVLSELGEATAARGGRAKRYFRITATGLPEATAARPAVVRMWR